MSRLIDWLNRKWVLILVFFAVTVFIHIGLQYYFWNWSAENFNNIVTPIATVISVALFVWLTWRQSRIIESQNTKPYFHGRIDRLRQAMEGSKVYASDAIYKTVNDFNFIGKIREVYMELRQSDEFRLWVDQHIQGQQIPLKVFDRPMLIRQLRFLSQFFVVPIQTYYRVEDLIREINGSTQLVDSDKIELKRIIKETLVLEFMKFVEWNLADQTIFLVPVIYGVSNPDQIVKFEQLHRSDNFIYFYDFFTGELGHPFAP